MGEPSDRPARRSGARLLLAAVLAGLGLLAVSRAPEVVQSLVPGMGALVARAWSAAAPEAVEAGAVAGRLTAAEAQALAAEAEEAWQRGDWAMVSERLTALAAAGPRSSEQDDRLYEAEINLSWALLAEARPEEAEPHLALALEVRPDGAEALEGLRIARQPPSSAQPAPVLEPPAAQVAAAQASAPSVAVASGEATWIIVQPGDTLFALARRFGTTVEAIKAANGLPCSLILAGQKLLIPVCVQPQPVVCVPVCPTPTPVCMPVVVPVIVCVPVCPTPTPVCVPVCPPVVCVPVCPTPVCVPVDP